MDKYFIDDCYIIGTALLYLNEISFDRLDKIKSNLFRQFINVKLTPESITQTVLEWHDFFEITDNNTISLTKGASTNKILVEMIFYDVLDRNIRECILDSIFNYKNVRCFSKKID